MAKIFRLNPFVSGGRELILPGGRGDPLNTGGTLGVQFFDYRTKGVEIPFMYIGGDLPTGSVKLNFLTRDRKPFLVSDSVRDHALAVGNEMLARYVEAFPDWEVETKETGGSVDALPRYKNANDDPWMSFLGCDVVERVDTELGEMAVGSSNVFEIRVGAGTDHGVPPIVMEGRSYRLVHDLQVKGGSFVTKCWREQPELFASIDVGKPSYEKLGMFEAMKQRKHGDKATQEVLSTMERVSQSVAHEFLERRFEDIKGAILSRIHARLSGLEKARSIIRSSSSSAPVEVQSFLEKRMDYIGRQIDVYEEMVGDIAAMEGASQASSAELSADAHYLPIPARTKSPRPR